MGLALSYAAARVTRTVTNYAGVIIFKQVTSPAVESAAVKPRP